MNCAYLNDLSDSEMCMLKALAHPVRLRILRLLSLRTMHACEIEEHLAVDLEQSSVAHHLRVLRNAGLVMRHDSGKETRYGIHTDALKRWAHIDAWIIASLRALIRCEG